LLDVKNSLRRVSDLYEAADKSPPF
jgi:hypothetical protein